MTNRGATTLDLETRRDYSILASLSLLISAAAFAFYYAKGAILLYGDAPAHINIARRVFDSRTPGFFQLGTVWLPLPHLIQIPFILNNWMWRTGVGGSIPSMAGYVAGVLGVFRLVRGLASNSAAWIAALIYALNPNLLYLQTTAMTESLYLALFVWTIVFFAEFVRNVNDDALRARTSLERCAIILAAAMLTRYDAWFLGAVLCATAGIYLWRKQRFSGPPRRAVVELVLLVFLTGGLWLAYNRANYANPLEFSNGAYSARAIQERSRTPTMQTYPGEHSARTATLYFLKASRVNLGEGAAQYSLPTAAFVALLAVIYFSRRFWPCILLWSPVVFYAACIAWGSVPIYVPDWWPFSYYNVRYGLQMLPAIAVFIAIGYYLLNHLLRARLVGTAAAILIVLSYSSVWSHGPICLREAEANGRARLQFDLELAAILRELPANSTILIDCSAHSGAVQLAGIPFRRVLRESNPPYWEIALNQPARSADYVIAIQGDPVWSAVRLVPHGLHTVAIVGTSRGLRAVVYKSTKE